MSNTQAQKAPYGSWQSPVSAELLCSEKPAYSNPKIIDGEIYWSESRPWEAGRAVVVHWSKQANRDLIPTPYSARSRVHEYGGDCWTVANGILYFVNDGDQQIYQIDTDHPSKTPRAVTQCPNWRFADLEFDRLRGRLLAIAEDHDANPEPENLIVSIDLRNDPARPEKLISGDDFYAYPRISPAGDRMCYLSWSHPDMPWDSTQLWSAQISEEGILNNPRLVAGEGNEAIFQPHWSNAGKLHYVSDQNNWWNIYRQEAGIDQTQLTHMEAEFGLPFWQFGMSTYGFLNEDRIIACYTSAGIWHLATVSHSSNETTTIDTPWTWISSIQCENDKVVFLAASPIRDVCVVSYSPYLDRFEVLAGDQGSIDDLKPYISTPETVAFKTSGQSEAYGFLYPPRNPNFEGVEGEKPPLIVLCHGGPTAATSATFNLKVQFWTSRGFAVFDLNYRGSTGYGREYRRMLYGNWGLFDWQDACSAATYAVTNGLADPSRLIIRGAALVGTAFCPP